MQGIFRIGRCCWLAGLLAGLMPAAAIAAQPTAWLCRTWQSDEGLPGNRVAGVVQTPDGFLWVAAQNGLVRFDGVRFTDVQGVDSLVGPGGRILRMLADRRGRLWLGKVGLHGSGSVICVEAGQTRAFTYDDGLPEEAVTELTEDGEGAVWTVSTGSVCRLRDGEVKDFTAVDGLSGGGRHHLASDGRGQLWFAKGGNVGVFRDGSFRTLLNLQGGVSFLVGSRAGGVWLGQGTHVLKYTGEGEPLDLGELAANRPAAQPSVLFEDRTGGLWVGTVTEGLFRFDGPGFTWLDLSRHEILSVTDDREGDIWVGTGGGGLHRLRPNAFDLQQVSGGTLVDSPMSVCQDDAGTLWAVTKSGMLARREGEQWKILSAADGWDVRGATCVTPAPGGGVWVGTGSNGLCHWRDGIVSIRFTKENGLAGSMVTALLTTPDGDVWLATEDLNAVQRMRDGRFQIFTLAQKFGPFGTLAVDAAGVVWAATSGGLLSRVNGDVLEDETSRTLGEHHPISALSATADGSLWIGYEGRGVGRLKRGRFSLLGKEQGLVDDFIYQIVPDGSGRMWFTTNRGLFSVEDKQLEAVADGIQTRVRPVAYGREEGLPTSQVNRGSWPSAWRGTDGRLWIPMVGGLAEVEPGLLTANREPPPVVIERVTVDGQAVAAYQSGKAAGAPAPLDPGRSELRLPPGSVLLELEYAGLSFVAPRNVAFRYRLHGLDRDWVEAGPRRVAYYNHLPPGNYRFQVIACNNDGVWNQEGASLQLAVLPHFWQTWWFRTLEVLMVMGIVGGVARLVERRRVHRHLEILMRHQAVERERGRIAKDLHDDLGARLSEIALIGELGQQAETPPERIRDDLRDIAGKARSLTRSLAEIVWAVSPQHDTFENFVSYTCNFAEVYLRLARIRFRLDIPVNLPDYPLTAHVRHHLFLIFKEAVHNIVKHAAASEVWIRVAIGGTSFSMSIEDNGKGFSVDAPATGGGTGHGPPGHGMSNMRERAGEIGARVEWRSQPGHGTTVRLEMDFQQP